MNAHLQGTEDSHGNWLCLSNLKARYSAPGQALTTIEKKDNFDIQNGPFEGKVYPGKIYRDEKGEDPSKLYFLGKGKFMIHKVSAETKEYRIVGGKSTSGAG